MLKKWVILFFTVMVMLTACQSQLYDQTEGNVADVALKTKREIRKQEQSTKPAPSLVVKQGLYVDISPVNLERDPSWLRNRIIIRGDQLPFSYYSRTIAKGANNYTLTKYQVGLDSSLKVTLNYSGSVRGALDLLASRTGYVYSIHGNKIYWQAFVTKTFDIAFMPGGTDYLMGKASGSTGSTTAFGGGSSSGSVSNYVSSDSSDSEYSNLKGTLSVWKDLDSTVKQLLTPDGKVMVSESTTSVTVRDRPANVELVGQYIKNLNHNLSKQVLVKVQVLDVQLQNDYEFGLNWQLITNAFNKSPFVINGNYGTPVAIRALNAQPTLGSQTLATPQFGFNPGQSLATNKIPSYTILLNALNQQGKVSVVSEPRVVCLNNQVSVIRIMKQQGYLASVQNTSLSSGSSTNIGVGTVTSQLTPGTLITGLTLYILPKILKDRIYLQVNADLSTPGSPAFTTISSGSSTNPNSTSIQVPNITGKSFNQRSMIRSGDTMILSGFRQVSNQAGANQFITSQALGGKGAAQTSIETIILITPIILHGSV